MTEQEVREAIAQAKAREAQHPHTIAVERYPNEIECRCGRVFSGRTRGIAVGAWQRHRTVSDRKNLKRA